jgi:hypothetical protein
MSDYAIIDKNGKVVNVIVADENFINEWLPRYTNYSLAIIREGRKGNIGQLYQDGKFYELVSFTDDLSPQIDGTRTTFNLTHLPQIDFDVEATKDDIKVILNNNVVSDFNYNNQTITFTNPPESGSTLITTYLIKKEVTDE